MHACIYASCDSNLASNFAGNRICIIASYIAGPIYYTNTDTVYSYLRVMARIKHCKGRNYRYLVAISDMLAYNYSYSCYVCSYEALQAALLISYYTTITIWWNDAGTRHPSVNRKSLRQSPKQEASNTSSYVIIRIRDLLSQHVKLLT